MRSLGSALDPTLFIAMQHLPTARLPFALALLSSLAGCGFGTGAVLGALGSNGGAPDPPPPPLQVVGFEPSSGAAGVSPDTEVVVSLSEQVDPTTVSGAVVLRDRRSQLVPLDVTAQGNSLVAVPREPLTLLGTYRCSIDATRLRSLQGVGITGQAPESDFTVRDGAWQPPSTVASTAPYYTLGGVLRQTGAGLFALWSRFEFTGTAFLGRGVYHASRTSPGPWAPVLQLSQSDAFVASSPNRIGTCAYAIRDDSFELRTRVLTQNLTSGNFVLDYQLLPEIEDFVVGSDSSGRPAIVYQLPNSNSFVAELLQTGRVVSPPLSLPVSATLLDMAVAEGGCVIVCVETFTNPHVIRAYRYCGSSSGWTQLPDPPLATSPSSWGNIRLGRGTGARTALYGVPFPAAGGQGQMVLTEYDPSAGAWTATETIFSPPPGTGFASFGLASGEDVSANGSRIVTIRFFASGPVETRALSFRPGVGWASPGLLLEADATSGAPTEVAVGFTDDGNGIVAWSEADSFFGPYTLRYARFTESAGFSEGMDIGQGGRPFLLAGDHGRFHLIGAGSNLSSVELREFR